MEAPTPTKVKFNRNIISKQVSCPITYLHTDQKHPLATVAGSGGAVLSLAWVDRGNFFSAGEDHCVRWWDAQTAVNVHTLVWNTACILCS